jgi:hypothetical protein
LGSPEDMFDFDDEKEFLDDLEQDFRAHPGLAKCDPVLRAGRRELSWFYTAMQGRVPVVGDAPADEVAAASRIAWWLSELDPLQRGAFVMHYDARRWPARIQREFGGLTSLVVRYAAMRRLRGATETLAEAEHAVVTELMAEMARAYPAKKLRHMRRVAESFVRWAERAYFEVRGNVPCVVPMHSREGA